MAATAHYGGNLTFGGFCRLISVHFCSAVFNHCCSTPSYLMSPSFLATTSLTVEMAALVFCPAWEMVSWVFLYLQEKTSGKNASWCFIDRNFKDRRQEKNARKAAEGAKRSISHPLRLFMVKVSKHISNSTCWVLHFSHSWENIFSTFQKYNQHRRVHKCSQSFKWKIWNRSGSVQLLWIIKNYTQSISIRTSLVWLLFTAV